MLNWICYHENGIKQCRNVVKSLPHSFFAIEYFWSVVRMFFEVYKITLVDFIDKNNCQKQ